jgi:subtilisin-like proprotein convertase family protein
VARADFTFSGSGDIPTGVGLVSVGTVSGMSGNVTGLTLDLNVSGGFNGDLYAYLVAPDQTTTATLLGVPGGNYIQIGSGYNVTLSDAAGVNIQAASQSWGAALTGTYQPVVSLATFNGLAANGNWRLFMVDQSSGDNGQSVLNSWNLSLTTAAVPEPDQVAAISLLGLIGLLAGSYRHWGRALGFKQG